MAKHSQKESVPRRPFTDREDLIELFFRTVSIQDSDGPSVLAFYGMGGVGKSRLCEELRRQLRKSEPSTIVLFLNFQDPGLQMEDASLATLSYQIQKYGISLPLFDVSLSEYWPAAHPYLPHPRSETRYLDDASTFTDMADAIQEIPGPGFVVKLAKGLKRIWEVGQHWVMKRRHPEIRELAVMEPQDATSVLRTYFVAEFRRALASHKGSGGTRGVIFLDVYDALLESQKRWGQEEWIPKLVAQLPGVKWVIFSRDQLSFQDYRGISVLQKAIVEFQDEHASKFLSSCGITDPAVQEVILACSAGVPYYLHLAVDIADEITKQERRTPVPGDFARTQDKVVDRFVSHLTVPEVETLKVLSVTRSWDHALFAYLVKRCNTQYQPYRYQDLARFSFIRQKAAKCEMHQLARDRLQRMLPDTQVQFVHTEVFRYWRRQLRSLGKNSTQYDGRGALAEAFYHGKAVLPADELYAWLTSAIRQIGVESTAPFLTGLYEELLDLLLAKAGTSPEILISVSLELGELYYSQARFKRAAECFHRALELATWAGPSDNRLAAIYARLGHVSGKLGAYADADDHIRKALDLLGPAGPRNYRTIAICRKSQAVNLALQGRYLEAEPVFREALELLELDHTGSSPDNELLRSKIMGDFAVTLRVLGRNSEVPDMISRSLEIKKRVLGPHHQDVAASYANLAAYYRTRGAYRDSEALYSKALEIVTASPLGSEHPRVSSVKTGLARTLIALKEFRRATDLLQDALAVRERVYGIQSSRAARVKLWLGVALREQGKYDEAEPLLEQSLEVFDRAPHTGAPVVTVLNELGELCRLRKQYSRGEEYLRRAQSLASWFPNPSHPLIADTFERLADLQRDQGNDAAAAESLQQALLIREGALGLDHPVVERTEQKLTSRVDSSDPPNAGRRLGVQHHEDK